MDEMNNEQLNVDVFKPLYEALQHLMTYEENKRDLAKEHIDIAVKNAEKYRNFLGKKKYDIDIQAQIDCVILLFNYAGTREDRLPSIYESLLSLRYFKKYQIPQIVDGLGEKISDNIDSASKLISEEFQNSELAYKAVLQETETTICNVIDNKITSILEQRAIAGMPSGPVFDAFEKYLEKLRESAKLSEGEELPNFKVRVVNKTKELMNILNEGVDEEITEYLAGER